MNSKAIYLNSRLSRFHSVSASAVDQIGPGSTANLPEANSFCPSYLENVNNYK